MQTTNQHAGGHATDNERAADRDTTRSATADVNSIFQQPWWLDAVAPGQWGEVSVSNGGRTVARMPYVVKKKIGLTLLTMPVLTQTLGPWLRPCEGKLPNRLAAEKDLIQALIKQLPRFDLFVQNFSPELTNWLPFYWAGFQQTTYYTYRLGDLTDLDSIWNGMRDNIRGDIRKAEKVVAVRTDLGIDCFLEANARIFERQGLRPPYSSELVRRLDAACVHHASRQMFFAEDAHGNIHAAVYIVWDSRCAHYLMGGSDPALRNSGAGSLLLWTAIQYAARVTQVFDFEGSMIESVERHFRAYGARQVPYFCVRKMNLKMKTLNAMRELWEFGRGK